MTPTLQTNLVPLLSKSVNIFIAVVIFYILKYLLELDFHCNCSGGIKWYDIVYLIGPPWAVFPLLYIVCKPYQKLCWEYFTRTYTYIFWEQLQFLVLLHSFWIAAVLLDGDWFACMLANHDYKEQADIPCKTRKSLTLNEINILTHHKNISMGIGLALTIITTFLWALRSFFEFRKPLEKVILNQILHEKEAHLIAELEKIAKEKAEIDNTEEVELIQHLVRNTVEVNGVSVPFHVALLRRHEALEKDADLKDRINNIAKQHVAHSNDEIIGSLG